MLTLNVDNGRSGTADAPGYIDYTIGSVADTMISSTSVRPAVREVIGMRGKDQTVIVLPSAALLAPELIES